MVTSLPSRSLARFRTFSTRSCRAWVIAWRGKRICRSQSEILLGAHMSIAGGPHLAIERACSINCTAMQIFVKNNMQWFARPLSTGEIRAFLDHQQREQLASVFAHANYLINLAAINPQF